MIWCLERASWCLHVVQRYMRGYERPSIPRNVTPIAGRIMWVRNLATRIRAPMDIFVHQRPQVLDSRDGKQIVRTYNKLNRVFLEFEILYHVAWLRMVNTTSNGTISSPFCSRLVIIIMELFILFHSKAAIYTK